MNVEWMCHGCRTINFKSRNTCFTCARSRPNNSPAVNKPGDWKCPKCFDSQFARNDRCRKCSTPRPAVAAMPAAVAVVPSSSQPILLRAGDWLCKACNEVQFASRVSCRKCKGSKPAIESGDDDADQEKNCLICAERIRNAGLVHGDDMHVVTCMECATQLRDKGEPCPLCRQPIERVLKTYQ